MIGKRKLVNPISAAQNQNQAQEDESIMSKWSIKSEKQSNICSEKIPSMDGLDEISHATSPKTLLGISCPPSRKDKHGPYRVKRKRRMQQTIINPESHTLDHRRNLWLRMGFTFDRNPHPLTSSHQDVDLGSESCSSLEPSS